MSTWQGFERFDFDFEGHAAILVCPKEAAAGRPWVWRAEFFGAFASVDEEMARRGYHIAYVSLSDRYGCPSAVQDMERFRAFLTQAYNLCEKAQLFGFSRGGLYAVNYALAYPQYVDRMYLDAPVLDIRSWPGGYGRGIGARREWEECKACYGLSDDEARAFCRNPLDRAGELAAHHIPIILVAGDSDNVVPYEENGERFAAIYRAAGGRIETIIKPHCGHHPHSLADPAPIVRFLTEDA